MGENTARMLQLAVDRDVSLVPHLIHLLDKFNEQTTNESKSDRRKLTQDRTRTGSWTKQAGVQHREGTRRRE